ncbi:4-O-dimethylallyl-L-tyrosine synthase [Colletotrichum spaethianum]|uniref:4-O-dimethylallyl-L-tyrosine synthase n=1 Tax=Colletotrichum spaethianum TaxID=700344 RepID=A0AA37LAS7_9PEZI|nr:4-O-dimethylallyl-L-tyrosine synthase [Colletotrichum spaethianum]GKT42565.1 4-O-dimethylallyl-L-tyrosine synthase [Colletotrichum spaethianum]
MGEMIMSHEPWDFLNSVLRFRDDDSQFWWDKTGRMFSKLLKYAGYSASEQYRELNFYSLFVAPELGPSPDCHGNVRRWRSPGTPDSTPIDFSWEWGHDNRAVIRYSFEPIGLHAGTDLDPLNRHATNDWIFKLQQQKMVPGLDLEWYNHFTKQILPHGSRTKTVDRFIEETTPKAGTVVALDIEKSGPVMKIYIYPGLKAEELGITNLELVEQSIRSLPTEQFQSLNAEPLLDFLKEGTKKYDFETGILAIDCLAPQDARIKVYIRAKHTTFDYMMDCITLGGRLDMSGEAIDDLKDFWRTFLADAPDILPEDAPGRASPGFYYTLGCGRAISPKVYISPNYFSKNDVDVLARLRTFFASRRTDSMMDNYEQALKDIFHYYVGCALHKGQLRVVTYLSPQSFDCEKDLIQGRKP